MIGVPHLLVSVRNLPEAQLAVKAAVDLLDIKDPARGALGAVAEDSLREIVAWVAERVPTSAALGELGEYAGPERPLNLERLPSKLRFAKLGLAGMALQPDWRRQWRAALRHLPSSVTPVAVAYADWQRARAPAPEVVLAEALETGCRTLLVDTFAKGEGDLFDCWPESYLAEFVAQAQASGLACALAGSLTETTLTRALACEPDIVAVRGAACQAGREGNLCPEKIGRLLAQVKRSAQATAAR